MTTEEYDALVNKINEASEILNRLKYKKISEFPKLEELTEDDTLIIVDGSLSVVGRITAKELMAWFNDNLKNFILISILYLASGISRFKISRNSAFNAMLYSTLYHINRFFQPIIAKK